MPSQHRDATTHDEKAIIDLHFHLDDVGAVATQANAHAVPCRYVA